MQAYQYSTGKACSERGIKYLTVFILPNQSRDILNAHMVNDTLIVILMMIMMMIK